MTASSPYTAETIEQATAKIDVGAVFEQLGRMPMLRMGARDRVYSETYVQFDVMCDRAKRRVLITLAADDTYTVEIGRVQRRTYEWVSAKIVRGVYADQLAQTVEQLYVIAFGG